MTSCIGKNRIYQTYLGSLGGRHAHEQFVIKRSLNHTGDRILSKESSVLRYLRAEASGSCYQHYLPGMVDSFVEWNRQINVFNNDQRAYSASQIIRRWPNGLDGRHVAWMFNRMLEGLGFAHRMGTIHCAVLPQHLLFDTHSHGLLITDWTHCKRKGRSIRHVPQRYQNWFPPEAHEFGPAVPATDIYMAARVALYLASGRVDDSELPEHLPRPIARFLSTCLYDSPRMRPTDAWDLHDEFQEVLEGVYGPPEFHPLEMI